MSTNQRTALQRIVATIAAFQSTTGNFPSPASDLAAERKLGTWLDKRRREHLNGTLQEAARLELDQYVDGWMISEDDLWAEWARDCSDFMLRTDREPSPTGSPEAERALGIWYRSQLGTAALGKLRPDREQWLREHCRLWAPISLQRPKAGL